MQEQIDSILKKKDFKKDHDLIYEIFSLLYSWVIDFKLSVES